MTKTTEDKPRCKICGTEYDTLDDAMKCIEKCKHKQDTEALPALIKGMDWEQSQIEVMWKTVAVDTTPEEFAYFLNVAQAAGLNPFLREIYCWKSGGKITIMTGRDGYLKTARKDPTFRGLHSMDVCEKDAFEMSYVDGVMQVTKHEIKDFNDRGKIIGAWAKVEFDGKKPIVVYASASEYKQSKDVWNRYESAMMRKVPESMALRVGAGITGLVTQEEIEVPSHVSAALKSDGTVDVEYTVVPSEIDEPADHLPPVVSKLVTTERQMIKYKLPGDDSQAMTKLKEYAPDTIILNKEKTEFKVGNFIVEISPDGSEVWSNVPKFADADFDVSTCVPCLLAGLVRAHGVPFVSGKYGLKFESDVKE